MTNKKGFTLIELLVVIAIIGILSAIGLVSLNGAREKARDAQRKSDIGSMRTALALYYDDNASTYPAGPTTITRSSTGTAIATGGALSSLAPTYQAALPAPPRTTDSYTYLQGTVTSGSTVVYQYRLYTQLEQPATPATFFYITQDGVTSTASGATGCNGPSGCNP